LAGYAGDFDPRRLRDIVDQLLATLDPDGPEPADQETSATPARGELWLRPRRDGRLGLEDWLAAEHGTQVRALIEQLATRRHHPPTGPLTAAHCRSARPRRSSNCATGPTPPSNSPPPAGEPHVMVTIDRAALRTGLGSAMLDYGQHLNAADTRRMACDCKIIPVSSTLTADPSPTHSGTDHGRHSFGHPA
jgi:hypothetical protein